MNSEELLRALTSGEEFIGFVRYEVELAPGVWVKNVVTLQLKRPDPLGRHSWHYLMENPSYAREQKIIQAKPFLVSLDGVSRTPEACDGVAVYFADLEEVAVFLEQFNKSLDDFHALSDGEMMSP